ncbi:kinase-like domain-containing protein [Roridomyces roridus]|uniref:Kinase-like domain-containing protein n=1 Tax=Roridomyces roridus TaxID=1738132 RepID=A0AAD7FWC1_9AGAR|nr:kinase-like domain-containing protein [Roridomyces roridus]
MAAVFRLQYNPPWHPPPIQSLPRWTSSCIGSAYANNCNKAFYTTQLRGDDVTPAARALDIAHSSSGVHDSQFSTVADAIRISDGTRVLIKKSEPDRAYFHEAQMFRTFCSDPLASEPVNRCIRLIEILFVPDEPRFDLIVMPFYYDWDLVPFLTTGEAVEFFSQIFEGLRFLHNKQVWHGDVKCNNILMDASPLFVKEVNPWRPQLTRDLRRLTRFRNRLRHPVKYYIIDFDLSGVHDPSKGPPRTLPGYGGTRGVPEFDYDQLCNPFAVDVYCLGSLIAGYFTEGENYNFGHVKKRGFQFMQRLVADMMNNDPAKRPSMNEVVSRFSDIKAGLSWWQLRSRCSAVDERPLPRVFKTIFHWPRQCYYIARRIHAIPAVG